MKEIKKFNIIDQSLDMEKYIRTNVGLFALQEHLEENEIYISTFGIVQCIDVYLRTLFFCNAAKDKFDIMESINKHFVVSHSYKSIEEFRQNFNDGMCAFSQEETFRIMLTAINERINRSRRLLLKDFNEVINNVSTIFDLISKYIDDIFTLLSQEIDKDTHSVHLSIIIGGIRISMSTSKDEANQHILKVHSNAMIASNIAYLHTLELPIDISI